MSDLPETVLQFGGGKFLRAFADLFIQQANDGGQNVGRVVVVQSTVSERARLLNQQQGRYHVLIRGLADGKVIEEVHEVQSIRRALVAQTDWNEVLAVGRASELRIILSNTTETGLTLEPGDRADAAPPKSFPAKLLLVLKARYESGLPGVTIVPCELIEDNADRLIGLILEQARLWQLPAAFTDWLQTECLWRNNLVDRIVTGKPAEHPLVATDPLLITAEPYALWAIEEQKPGPFFENPAIRRTPDVTPFYLRKVRILNAAHTSLVNIAAPRGFTTVREAVLNPEIAGWLRGLLFEEIVPTLEGRVEDPEAFAKQTLERFANPFLEHKLSDIALHQETKIKIRLVPTREEYRAKFGREPRYLNEAIG